MPFQQVDVQKVYAEDDALRREDALRLVEWNARCPHHPPLTELQAALFLHSNYYDLEASKTCVGNFFNARGRCPEIFRNLSLTDELVKITLDVVAIVLMRERTPEGYAVVVTRLLNPDPSVYHMAATAKIFYMLMETHMLRHGPSNGLVLVHDTWGGTFTHFTKVLTNLAIVKKNMFYVQEAVPLRLKQVHFVNLVPFMDKVMGLIRPLMKKEVAEMLRFHPNLQSLHNLVPKCCLPSEHGGTCAPIASLQEETKRFLAENCECFEELEKLHVDDIKQSSKSTKEESFSIVADCMDGSFKKLNID